MKRYVFEDFGGKTPSGVVAAGGFESGFKKAVLPPAANDPPAAAPEQPAEKIITYSEKDLSDSKSKGFEEGYAKGFKDATDAAEEVNKSILETSNEIVKQAQELIKQRNLGQEKQAKDLASITLRIARKIAGKALKSEPLVEVEEVISKSLKMLFEEPKILINVNDRVAGELTKKIDSIAEKADFTGVIEVKGSDKIGLCSCDISWQGGGVVSDKESVFKEINRIYEDLSCD